VSGAAIDAAVQDLLLRMIIPSELELSLAVEHEVKSQAAALSKQWKLRLEKAEYEARRAERRYMAVDPDNRVVARTLEAQWEACLQELESIRRQVEDAKRERHIPLTDEDRIRVRELARDLPAVWHASTTQPADRKAMLRLAIEAVTIRPIDVPERRTPEAEVTHRGTGGRLPAAWTSLVVFTSPSSCRRIVNARTSSRW